MRGTGWRELGTACLVLIVSACAVPASTSPSASSSVTAIPSPAATASAQPPPRPTATASRQPTRVEDFDPANFTHSTDIDNPYFPMRPGTRSVWRGHAFDDDERVSRAIEMTVTGLEKTIAGVRTRVARERDITNGEAEEIELAFYAQDDRGTVWYFGEYSEEYDDGSIVKSPLWLAGIRSAYAGILMQPQPQTGTPSYAEGSGGTAEHWNDQARVDRVGVSDTVPTGHYSDVVILDEFNPDEPGRAQLKSYAPGVGGIRTGWRGQNEEEKEELVLASRTQLSPRALADVERDAYDQERRAYDRKPEIYGKTKPMTKT